MIITELIYTEMKRTIVILSAAALLLVSSISASAQIGGYDYDPFKSYEPSANAKSMDPCALPDAKVVKSATKSGAAICAAYENLPKELIPYQPYYEFYKDGLFFKPDGNNGESPLYDEDFDFVIFKSGDARIHGSAEYEDGRFFPLRNNPKEYIPAGERALNAYFSAFLADPNSSFSIQCLFRAMAIYHAMKNGEFVVRTNQYSDASTNLSTAYTDRGEMAILYELEPDRLARLDKLAAYAFEVSKQSDFDKIRDMVNFKLQYAVNNIDGDNDRLPLVLEVLDEAVEGLTIAKANNAFATYENAARIEESLTKFDGWRNDILLKLKPRHDMPATYTAPSDVLAKFKTEFEQAFPQWKGYKIYSLSNSWGRLYRDMKMQVLQRRYWEFAVIENRADGEKVLHEYRLMQNTDAFGNLIDDYFVHEYSDYLLKK